MSAASKYLSNLVYSYKGMGLSMVCALSPVGKLALTEGQGTMICGWDKTVSLSDYPLLLDGDLALQGPRIILFGLRWDTPQRRSLLCRIGEYIRIWCIRPRVPVGSYG